MLSESDSAVIVGKRYREWLSGPDSFAFLAEEDGRLVGYVVGFYDERTSCGRPVGSVTSTASMSCPSCAAAASDAC